MTLDTLADQAAKRFRDRFGSEPAYVVAAPGRVNLIGEHVDYNGGVVLPMAVDRHIVAAAAPQAAANSARIYSGLYDAVAEVERDSGGSNSLPAWARYVGAVLRGFARRGCPPPAFDAVIESDVPPGAGLSSSAALTVCTATLVEALVGQPLECIDKARLCQKAEHEAVGVPCGIMDPVASICGRPAHALRLDCRTLDVAPVPLWGEDLTLLVIDSGVERQLAAGHYAERRSACEAAAAALGVDTLAELSAADLPAVARRLDARALRRVRHVVTEIGRTAAAVCALRSAHFSAFGRLMDVSHVSLRDDFEVSCAELDLLVALLSAADPRGAVVGSRLTGAGFGGCVISLVRTSAAEAVAQRALAEYNSRTGRHAAAWRVQAVDGARVLKA